MISLYYYYIRGYIIWHGISLAKKLFLRDDCFIFLPQKKLFHQTEPLKCFKTKNVPSIMFHETSVEKQPENLTVVLTKLQISEAKIINIIPIV